MHCCGVGGCHEAVPGSLSPTQLPWPTQGCKAVVSAPCSLGVVAPCCGSTKLVTGRGELSRQPAQKAAVKEKSLPALAHQKSGVSIIFPVRCSQWCSGESRELQFLHPLTGWSFWSTFCSFLLLAGSTALCFWSCRKGVDSAISIAWADLFLQWLWAMGITHATPPGSFESGINLICCWKRWSHLVLWAQSFTPTSLPSAVTSTYVGLWWAGWKGASHCKLNSLTHSFDHEKLHIGISKCYLRSARSASARSLSPTNGSGYQRRKLKWQEASSCCFPAVVTFVLYLV